MFLDYEKEKFRQMWLKFLLSQRMNMLKLISCYLFLPRKLRESLSNYRRCRCPLEKNHFLSELLSLKLREKNLLCPSNLLEI